MTYKTFTGTWHSSPQCNFQVFQDLQLASDMGNPPLMRVTCSLSRVVGSWGLDVEWTDGGRGSTKALTF